MPTYNYECQNCKQHHEVIKKVEDKDPIYCDFCGKNSLKKIISYAPTVQYKGDKWFRKSGEY